MRFERLANPPMRRQCLHPEVGRTEFAMARHVWSSRTDRDRLCSYVNQNKDVQMRAHAELGIGLAMRRLALTVTLCCLVDLPALAQELIPAPPPLPATPGSGSVIRYAQAPTTSPIGPGAVSPGYGPPVVRPGFRGFGLGYHLGHGYGGNALGVGREGGYPLYGGPGYIHPGPRLHRIGGIAPFFPCRGPGYPTPENPNFFGRVGPLVSEPPVIDIRPEPGEAGYSEGFGNFSGTLPYAPDRFAPFTAMAAQAGSGNRAGGTTQPIAPAGPGELPNPIPAPITAPPLPPSVPPLPPTTP